MDNSDRILDLSGAKSVRFVESYLPESLRFGPEGPAREAIVALQAHPRFPAAARFSLAAGASLYRGNRLLNLMANDHARLWITVCAVHLHALGRPHDPNSGLTVSRLAAICSEQGLCSAGRTNAMLMLMRASGYLAAAPTDEDRRLRRLVPTERLMSLHRDRIRAVLDGCAMLMPDRAETFSAQSHPGFAGLHVSRFCELFVSGFRDADHVAGIGFFADRNAGLMILWDLLVSHETDDSFPPAVPLSPSISALSRRFGVSRVHVRRLLQDAVSQGLLERTDENSFRILPRLATMASDMMATHFLVAARCARLACAALDRERAAA